MSENTTIFAEALRLEQEGEAGVLLTLVDAGGSTPRHDVARMILRADGSTTGTIGGGAIEHQMLQRAAEVLERGDPTFLETTLKAVGMGCGGAVKVLLEPLGVGPRLTLFGAGHVAVEIAPLAAHCGFAIQVVDDRPELASTERFPDAQQLVHSFAPEAWDELGLGPRNYCVVVTRGHEHDTQVVRALIERDLTYLGMMGSRKKVATIRKKLADDGVSAEALARLHSPIGLDISSETPAEIAVSVVGEMIAVRRGAERR